MVVRGSPRRIGVLVHRRLLSRNRRPLLRNPLRGEQAGFEDALHRQRPAGRGEAAGIGVEEGLAAGEGAGLARAQGGGGIEEGRARRQGRPQGVRAAPPAGRQHTSRIPSRRSRRRGVVVEGPAMRQDGRGFARHRPTARLPCPGRGGRAARRHAGSGRARHAPRRCRPGAGRARPWSGCGCSAPDPGPAGSGRRTGSRCGGSRSRCRRPAAGGSRGSVRAGRRS